MKVWFLRNIGGFVEFDGGLGGVGGKGGDGGEEKSSWKILRLKGVEDRGER